MDEFRIIPKRNTNSKYLLLLGILLISGTTLYTSSVSWSSIQQASALPMARPSPEGGGGGRGTIDDEAPESSSIIPPNGIPLDYGHNCPMNFNGKIIYGSCPAPTGGPATSTSTTSPPSTPTTTQKQFPPSQIYCIRAPCTLPGQVPQQPISGPFKPVLPPVQQPLPQKQLPGSHVECIRAPCPGPIQGGNPILRPSPTA
jgi:hypothetical protein